MPGHRGDCRAGCSGSRVKDPRVDEACETRMSRAGSILETMEIALTPLEFMRRSRRLFGDREAVVDGDLRLTYDELFDRCDRWSVVLQRLGVQPGDRVAYIAPNTHAQLEVVLCRASARSGACTGQLPAHH